MNLCVFAVRDRATDSFGTPFFVASKGQALRSFSDEVNRKVDDNMLNKHSEDYDLYELGTFNSETGLFDAGVPKMISIGKDVLIKE
ncbi:MAG: nonstructural protein [Microvirus sp.]|nr:MAG: nonstructural protein [Microvirus sp.]